MDEAEEMCGPAVISCCNTSEMLELIETALNGISFLVGLEIVGDRALTGRVAWDDSLCPDIGDGGADGIAVIGLVSQHAAGRESIQQSDGEGCVTALSGRQNQA